MTLKQDINTKRRVKNRRRLISKAGLACYIDQNSFSFSNDGKKIVSASA